METRNKSKKKIIWPWVMLLLLILVGTWMFIKVKTKDIHEPKEAEEIVVYEPFPVDSDKADVNTVPKDFNREQRVIDFLEFVNSKKAKKSIGESNVITLQALVKMSQALNAITEENKKDVAITKEIKLFNGGVNNMVNTPALADNPDDLKKVLVASSKVINELQKKNFPSLERETQKAGVLAESLRTDKSVEVQKNKVEDYFVAVANIIDEMEKPS